MSSIVIKGNTSGQIELAAPDVAGSTTLTLPTGSGTVITDTAPKAGNVIQVVSTRFSTTSSTTSTSFVNTGYSLSITPSSTSSKILVLTYGTLTNTSTGSSQSVITIYRNNTTNLSNADGLMVYENASSGGFQWVPASMQVLDSPNTTSSVTYTVYLKAQIGGTAYYSLGVAGNGITLMEIAG